MKWLPVFALFVAMSSLPAEWKTTEIVELAKLAKGASVRQANLVDRGTTARLTAVVFSSKAYGFRVIDSTAPGSTKLASSLAESGCVAGVNGGYFHEDFRPVGLLIADGRQIQPFETARLLSGVLAVRGNRPEIGRSSKFGKAQDVSQAIQCGPMLVEGGHATVGLNHERTARRTIVATDGHGQWALIYTTSVTLADAANILTLPGVLGDWAPVTALNLDGGSSSGLWASGNPSPVSLPEFGHVRNYLGIVPR